MGHLGKWLRQSCSALWRFQLLPEGGSGQQQVGEVRSSVMNLPGSMTPLPAQVIRNGSVAVVKEGSGSRPRFPANLIMHANRQTSD